MPNATAIPRDDTGTLTLRQHLTHHLPNYAALLEVSADDLAQLKSGADWFDHILKAQDTAQNTPMHCLRLNARCKTGRKRFSRIKGG